MYWIEPITVSGQPALSYKNVIYSNRLPIDIAVDTVKRITERYPPPYTLFASGGIDSQACIYAWAKSGIPFKVVFVQYENEFNLHDFCGLPEIIEHYKLELEVLRFDVLSFLKNNLKEYVLKYNCVSPMICTHFAMSEIIKDSTVVFSGNYTLPNSSVISPVDWSWLNYKNISKRNIIPSFFMEDPELVFSFHKIHAEVDLNVSKDPAYDTSIKIHNRSVWQYKVKYLTYQQAGFTVIPQEIKLTGFEKIKDYCDVHFPITSRERVKYASMPSKRSFEIKFRYPWLQLVNEHMPKIIY